MAKSFIKRFFNKIDRSLNVDTFRYFYKIKSLLGFKGKDQADFTALKEKARLLTSGRDAVQLHLGCGKNRFDGFINIDQRQTSATDLECDIVQLPFEDNTVDRIETYHVIEHMPRHDVPRAMKEWHRVMKPGGVLIIECPNFDQAVREYLDGNEDRIDNIFGLQRFPGDTHVFGYNFNRLKAIVEQAGFTDVTEGQPRDYHKDLEPCMRLEAKKH